MGKCWFPSSPKVENAEYSQCDCLLLEQGTGTAAPGPPQHRHTEMRVVMGVEMRVEMRAGMQTL